jgi:hypothetical protein
MRREKSADLTGLILHTAEARNDSHEVKFIVEAMKMRAYVMIACQAEDRQRITEELHTVAGVVLADIINGPHPVIAVVEGADTAGLADRILFRIRKMEGVKDITVYITKPESSTSSQTMIRQRTGSGS